MEWDRLNALLAEHKRLSDALYNMERLGSKNWVLKHNLEHRLDELTIEISIIEERIVNS